MRFSSLLAVAGFAAAAPAALEVRADPTWTLRDFVRTCDDTKNLCAYKFDIVTSSGKVDHCQINDRVLPSDPNPQRSARFSSPSNLPCSQGSPIFVNIGYDTPGNFWVVVPVNTATKRNAFFGYNADEMRDRNVVKPDHTSNELVWGQFKREAEPEPVALEARDNLGQWTVKNLVRTCSAQKCDYKFNIARTVGGGPITCSLSVAGNSAQSFYAVPCQQAPNWVISWGFNAAGRYAVMTVVSASQSQNAWFGFNNVQSTTNFPDSGPSDVAPQ